jgi:hypothetical protein
MLGILYQFLAEFVDVLTKGGKISKLSYFVRERLDQRERRSLFDLLNQIQNQIGLELKELKSSEISESLNEKAFLVHDLRSYLSRLDNFVSTQRDSSGVSKAQKILNLLPPGNPQLSKMSEGLEND